MSAVTPIYCHLCETPTGYIKAEAGASTALRNSQYCSPWCAEQPAPDRYHSRNMEFHMLNVAGGMTPGQIAENYGVERPVVYRILGKRGVTFS